MFQEGGDLSSIFQMEILRQVRTGNPLLDAILFSALTFFITRLFNGKYLKKFRSWWTKIKHDESIKYVIERQQPLYSDGYSDDITSQEKNKLYYALAWYLRKEKCMKEHSKSYKVIIQTHKHPVEYDNEGMSKPPDADTVLNNTECILIPTSDILIEYEDFIISGDYEYQEDDKGKEIRDKFVLSVERDVADRMDEFFESILRQYVKHEQLLMKGHKLWSLNPDDYGGPRLYWRSSAFRSHTNISNVILRNNAEQRLEEDIETFLRSAALYNEHGKVWKRGYLFYGPPGTGKTSLVKGIATKTKFNIYNVKLSRFQTDGNMEKILKEIPSRSIVLFEDVDCMSSITHKRKDEDDETVKPGEVVEPKVTTEEVEDILKQLAPVPTPSPVSKTKKKDPEKPTLSTLLNFIDGIDSPEGIIVIMTTNHMEKLDPALLRDGRIDMRLYLGYCTRQQIIDLAANFFKLEITMEDLSDIPEEALSPASTSRIMMDIAFRHKKMLDEGQQDIPKTIKELLLQGLKEALSEVET